MDSLFESLTKNTLRGRIADRIREAIMDGTLREGEKLVERKLAGQFATSLTAVREALIQLHGEGFVTKTPNSATYVIKLSLEEIEKIYVIRKLLEGYAVEEATRLATPEQIEHLEKTYSDLVTAANGNDPRALIAKDIYLHEAIWQITGNEYLQSTLRRIVLPLFSFAAIRFETSDHIDLLHDASVHLPFLQAMKTKNPEAAKQAFLEALDEWLALAQSYFFSIPAQAAGTPKILSETEAKPGLVGGTGS